MYFGCFLGATAFCSTILVAASSPFRRHFLLAMSLALGLSVRNPFADLVALVLGKGDLRSMFCLIVFSIVVLVLGSCGTYSTMHPMLTYPKHISQTPLRTLFARISPSNRSATISVVWMTVRTIISLQIIFVHLHRQKPHSHHLVTLFLRPTTRHFILQTAHQYHYAPPSTFFTASQSSQSPPWSLFQRTRMVLLATVG